MKRFLVAIVVGVLRGGLRGGHRRPRNPDPTSPAANTPGAAHEFSADLPDTHIDPAKIGPGIAAPKEQQNVR